MNVVFKAVRDRVDHQALRQPGLDVNPALFLGVDLHRA